MNVPQGTAEMLVKTIVKSHRLNPKTKKMKAKEPSPRERLKVARTHATKLLKYANTGSSHPNSIAKRSDRLYLALDHLDAVIWLALAYPSVDVPEVLNKPVLDSDELTDLIRSIDAALSTNNGARTGRPVEKVCRIVRAGCIAWIRAGRKRGYRWDDAAAGLVGPLPELIRDLFSLCAGPQNTIHLTDAALHSQLKAALPYCEVALTRRTR